MAYKASNKNEIEKSKHGNAKTVADINSYVTEAGGYSLTASEKEKFNREYRHLMYAISGVWVSGNILS